MECAECGRAVSPDCVGSGMGKMGRKLHGKEKTVNEKQGQVGRSRQRGLAERNSCSAGSGKERTSDAGDHLNLMSHHKQNLGSPATTHLT